MPQSRAPTYQATKDEKKEQFLLSSENFKHNSILTSQDQGAKDFVYLVIYLKCQ